MHILLHYLVPNYIKSEGMEAKDIEKYVCPVLAGKGWRLIKFCGNSMAIHRPVSNQYFPNFYK